MNNTSCDTCVYNVYDDELDCYVCQINMDEDEMCRFLSQSDYNCPYYRFEDDSFLARKQ